MIFGIGHDVVENSRIATLLATYGQAFAHKILSSHEFQIFSEAQNQARYLAKRFAAKEAFAKACGTGIRAPIFLNAISVLNDSLGKPQFAFDEKITQWLKIRKIAQVHLSISDERQLASAFVVLEVQL